MSEQPVGAEIAGYRIESVIGRGGMAVVYRAEDTRLGRKVALKLLAPALGEQEQFKLRFIQESRLAASLDHPNIIPIYEAGNADGVLFIAMRYVAGSDLKVALAGDSWLSPSRTLGLFDQIGDALDAAHALGLVHRDVKPANVLLTSFSEQTDHVYLTDFGLTKRASSLTVGLTGTGHFLGTIDYVAPEQIAGKPVDARTDIYALGCVLFECLTGRVPFSRDDDAATLWAHLVDTPPPVSAVRGDLSPAVDAVVARAMAKSPEDRYANCHAMVRELRGALELPAPVRGGRSLGGIDVSPALGRANLEHDQQTRAPVEHPSFPPGSFPPGSGRAAARSAAHRAYEPEYPDADSADGATDSRSDADGATDSRSDADGATDRPDADDATDSSLDADDADGYEASEVGAGDSYELIDEDRDDGPRQFARRLRGRWSLVALILTLAAIAVAAVVILLPRNGGTAKLAQRYHSGPQFNGISAPFNVDTPADWVDVDDPVDVDVTLSPGGQTMASLFSSAGANGSWNPVGTLLKSSPSRASGLWVHAQQNLPDRSSWQNLQAAVRKQLPASVYFDGGYQTRTVAGMHADEMGGHFEDPATNGTTLNFLVDVVQYQTPVLTSSVWVLFFAAPDNFPKQRTLFDRVRNSISFQ
jgi:serine/threonine protein kinase